VTVRCILEQQTSYSHVCIYRVILCVCVCMYACAYVHVCARVCVCVCVCVCFECMWHAFLQPFYSSAVSLGSYDVILMDLACSCSVLCSTLPYHVPQMYSAIAVTNIGPLTSMRVFPCVQLRQALFRQTF
jgi:hypothetical protein